jgi:signal transduction histidine kinase
LQILKLHNKRMSSPIVTTRLDANRSALQNLSANAAHLARHSLIVIGFCTAIAVVLWLAKPNQRFDVQLVYSLATGLSSWLVIDLSRFFIDVKSPFGFPRGWRGVTVIFIGVCFGFVVGTLAGDGYSGRSTFGLLPNQPRFVLYLFLFTVSIGIGVSYFFYASGKSSYLTRELETSRRQATEAQLKLLQSQLEPHMLFNTLANLRALIATDPARATQMLDSLIDYLRATLSASRATSHSLADEFARLGDYLALMQVRMGPRLTYTLDLPTELATQSVPTLLLQPLVENAIKHGLEPKIEGGSVAVSARLGGQNIVLDVIDSGVGLKDGSGFGLAQIRERLQATYGEQATIYLGAGCPGFTRASVAFPYKIDYLTLLPLPLGEGRGEG